MLGLLLNVGCYFQHKCEGKEGDHQCCIWNERSLAGTTTRNSISQF